MRCAALFGSGLLRSSGDLLRGAKKPGARVLAIQIAPEAGVYPTHQRVPNHEQVSPAKRAAQTANRERLAARGVCVAVLRARSLCSLGSVGIVCHTPYFISSSRQVRCTFARTSWALAARAVAAGGSVDGRNSRLVQCRDRRCGRSRRTMHLASRGVRFVYAHKARGIVCASSSNLWRAWRRGVVRCTSARRRIMKHA